MQTLITKSKASVVALILVLTVAAAIVALPVANAQVRKKTYAFIGAIPNPVGVGQEVLLHVGITDYLATAADGWEGLTVTVTRPDNTTETLGPFRTDGTGGTGTNYVPSQVGTYYLQTHFPAQSADIYDWFGNYLYTINYEASTSEKLALIVQQEPLPHYPEVQLPTEYWTRPIDAQLREWSPIAGNWVWHYDYNWISDLPNYYTPYNDGPETAHILWAKPVTKGGLVGGELGEHAYEEGDAYEGFIINPVILNGILYYNKYKEGFPTQEVVAVNLHTGEELWCRPLEDPGGVSRRLTFGQNFYWDSYNYHGAFSYLWATVGNTWHAFDPFTGNWVYTMTDVPSGTIDIDYNIFGPKGEIYRYTVDVANGWMTLWNSSRVGSSEGSWGSEVTGQTLNATLGIEWNVTIPTSLSGEVHTIFFEDRIIGGSTSSWISVATDPVQLWAIRLDSGHQGELLFNTTWSQPLGNLTITYKGASSEEGIFVISPKETRIYYAFSVDTGTLLWSTTEPEQYLQLYDSWGQFSRAFAIVYGKVISVGMGGIVYAYNAKTGELEWKYEAYDPLNEILWSNNWPLYMGFITDGKIYVGHEEHSPIDPKPRGAPFICLNATTGDVVWRANGLFRQTEWGGQAIIGDSIIAVMDTYDQRIYAIGKGPSATTVTASPKVSAHGSSVVIEGTVTDVSPGTEEYALRARFPNGVPAVSDADMSEWMKYVYKQFAVPMDVTGVEVTLDTVDPNGNWIHIGTVTSDMSGMFKKMFTPEVPGEYTIIATFMGSKSYWPSYAQTAIGVGPAPEEPATPGGVQRDIDQSAENLMNSLTPILYGTIVAVVVTICLVLYTLWTVRKQRK